MWGSISGAASGAAGAAGMGIGAVAVDGLIDSSVYIGQTLQSGGDLTVTGVLTSFVVGGGSSAVGSVVSIPKGTTMNIGNVAPQTIKSTGTVLKGGADQIVIPLEWNLNWIQSIREVSVSGK